MSVLRWPNLLDSIRRFAGIVWFSRIVSGFPNRTPFLRIALLGGLKLANHRFEAVRANRSHVMKRVFFFLWIDSCESPRFALRIAGPSKCLWCPRKCRWGYGMAGGLDLHVPPPPPNSKPAFWWNLLCSATKMTGRPGHWSEPGEYNILFLGSILVISSQDSSALGYREFTQEGAMTISPFAARERTSAPQW